uniref:Uncharacterized protein n=1 Tax=Populus alba TaxID=43335 RepID=A0A4U5QEZ0_POPAL|nr:hypothetical protein D5086_0000098580 [Populus alba]
MRSGGVGRASQVSSQEAPATVHNRPFRSWRVESPRKISPSLLVLFYFSKERTSTGSGSLHLISLSLSLCSSVDLLSSLILFLNPKNGENRALIQLNGTSGYSNFS